MARLRFQIAPDVEFKMELEVEGVGQDSRDYDIQQHKAEVYQEFFRSEPPARSVVEVARLPKDVLVAT